MAERRSSTPRTTRSPWAGGASTRARSTPSTARPPSSAASCPVRVRSPASARSALDGGSSPGNSPASVTFQGDMVLGAANDLTMELGGTALGTGYDHLSVLGTASLNGRLAVAYYGGFSASLGESFDLFDLSSSSGTFSSLRSSDPRRGPVLGHERPLHAGHDPRGPGRPGARRVPAAGLRSARLPPSTKVAVVPPSKTSPAPPIPGLPPGKAVNQGPNPRKAQSLKAHRVQ